MPRASARSVCSTKWRVMTARRLAARRSHASCAAATPLGPPAAPSRTARSVAAVTRLLRAKGFTYVREHGADRVWVNATWWARRRSAHARAKALAVAALPPDLAQGWLAGRVHV